MNLEKELLVDRTKEHIQKIVDYVDNDPVRFKQLLALTEPGKDERLREIAAWPLGHVGIAHPSLANPHLSEMLKRLTQPGHPAIRRNLLRILQFVEFPEDLQGMAFDICYEFLCSMKEPIAVRAFSMSVVYNIAKPQPDLLKEIRTVLQEFYPHWSAGLKSRAKKIIKAINKDLRD